jgi:beta-galactosidase/beta-glucuronidase
MPPRLLAAFIAAAVAVASSSSSSPPSLSAYTLRDNAVVADAETLLDGPTWTLQSDQPASPRVPSTVPGDILTDMQRATLLPDPWMDASFVALPKTVLDAHNWTVTSSGVPLPVSPAAASGAANISYLLVLDGVKMAADVSVNGQILGGGSGVTDQFLRCVCC